MGYATIVRVCNHANHKNNFSITTTCHLHQCLEKINGTINETREDTIQQHVHTNTRTIPVYTIHKLGHSKTIMIIFLEISTPLRRDERLIIRRKNAQLGTAVQVLTADKWRKSKCERTLRCWWRKCVSRTECCVSAYYHARACKWAKPRSVKSVGRPLAAVMPRHGPKWQPARWRCIDFYTTTTMPPVAPPRCSPPLVVWARRMAPAATHCSTRTSHTSISTRHTHTHTPTRAQMCGAKPWVRLASKTTFQPLASHPLSDLRWTLYTLYLTYLANYHHYYIVPVVRSTCGRRKLFHRKIVRNGKIKRFVYFFFFLNNQNIDN